VLAQVEDSPGTLDPVLEYNRAGQGGPRSQSAWPIRKVAVGRAACTGSPSTR